MGLTMETRHGTTTGYARRCRCDDCCRAHTDYERNRRARLRALRPSQPTPVEKGLPPRFWRRVDTSGECWIWLTPTREGYGRFRLRRVRKVAHRWTWEEVNGPVPEGLQLDHLCRNRACVNPAHLSAVTPRENLMAPGSLSPTKANALKTHCVHGHEFTPENTYVLPSSGGRRCRACIKAWRRRRAEAKWD